MRADAAVRMIDDLGRVVIPKEMRKELQIEVGDYLEIFMENGYVFIKKYNAEDCD